jgi:polygalacturonase
MRKYTLLLLAFFVLCGLVPARHSAQQTEFDVRRYGAKCDNSTDDRAAINTANTAAAVNGGTLLIPGKCVVGSNLTIPSNVNLRFALNGQLKPSSTFTVTINGDIEPIQQQIFAGAGTVTFASNKKVPLFSPYWWGATGDGSTDDTAAWTAMFAAIPDGATVGYIPATANYKITSTPVLVGRDRRRVN